MLSRLQILRAAIEAPPSDALWCFVASGGRVIIENEPFDFVGGLRDDSQLPDCDGITGFTVHYDEFCAVTLQDERWVSRHVGVLVSSHD